MYKKSESKKYMIPIIFKEFVFWQRYSVSNKLKCNDVDIIDVLYCIFSPDIEF